MSIQASWRWNRVLSEQLSLDAASMILPGWEAPYVQSRRSTVDDTLRSENAIVVIQSTWRSCFARSQLCRETSAVKLQSRFRGYVARDLFCRSRKAATLLQALFRGEVTRRMHQRWIVAAKIIQLRWRDHLQVSHDKETLRLLRLQNHCATVLQSEWRSWHRKRQHCRHHAAIKIQSAGRGLCMRLSYRDVIVSAVLIQSFFRGTRALQNRRLWQDAAQTIQRAWQFYTLRPAYIEGRRTRHISASMIQAVYVDWKMQPVLDRLDSATELLQRTLRGVFSRSTSVYALLKIKVALSSSTTSSYRRIAPRFTISSVSTKRRFERTEATARNLSAIIIQSFVRGCLCRMSLPVYQRPSRPPFSVVPSKPREDPLPVQRAIVSTRHSPTSVSASDLGDVYSERFENRAREIIFNRADALASIHVARLLGEYAVYSAPCLIRLAHSTRETQLLSRFTAQAALTISSPTKEDESPALKTSSRPDRPEEGLAHAENANSETTTKDEDEGAPERSTPETSSGSFWGRIRMWS